MGTRRRPSVPAGTGCAPGGRPRYRHGHPGDGAHAACAGIAATRGAGACRVARCAGGPSRGWWPAPTPGAVALGGSILALALLAAAGARATSGSDGAPLSAIDWLDQAAREGAEVHLPPDPAPGSDAGTALGSGAGFGAGSGLPLDLRDAWPGLPAQGGIVDRPISVAPIDRPTPDALGLVPAERIGLPRAFWGDTAGEALAAQLRQLRPEALPALGALARMLLLAEFDPPPAGTGRGALFAARIDKLIEMGALDQALALVEAAGPETPALFARWLDIALLTGAEDAACAALRSNPGLSADYAARIFCLARGGDWTAAALTLRSAVALGLLDARDEALIARFLDPELFEDAPVPPPPARPTPLQWRMFEAIGEPVATSRLPLAFAQADLRPTVPWRTQVEAAERLARSGAIPANRLMALYTAGAPAASGMVWDRLAAIQRLDTALARGDAAAVATATRHAWARMSAAGLELPLAEVYGPALLARAMPGDAGGLAFRLALLGPDFAVHGAGHRPGDAHEAALAALAALPGTDAVAALAALDTPLAAAIAEGFRTPAAGGAGDGSPVPPGAGPQVLAAMLLLQRGAAGDLRGVAEGLAGLRAAGFDAQARRIALQLMILEPRP